MNRKAIMLVAALAVAGCGGTTAGVTSGSGRVSTLAALGAGATRQTAYLGGDNLVTLGAPPVMESMALLGGGQVELEVVSPDGSPIRFEVWRAHVDGTTTLEIPVDAASGFALEELIRPKTGPGPSCSREDRPAAPSFTSTASAACTGACSGGSPVSRALPASTAIRGSRLRAPRRRVRAPGRDGDLRREVERVPRGRRQRLRVRRADLRQRVRRAGRRSADPAAGPVRGMIHVHVEPRRRRRAVASGVRA